MIAVHCENDGVINYLRKTYRESGCTEPKYHPLSRPARCEAEAVDRLLHLAAMAGDAPLYIVHLSSKEGLMEVMKARASHQKNFAVETCTQYLTLTDEMYEDPKEGLKSDHVSAASQKRGSGCIMAGIKGWCDRCCGNRSLPVSLWERKQAGAQDFTACPNGAPGVEERMRILFSEGVMKGRITLPQMVHYLCTNPSRMYGLYPQKGTLLPGSDADLILLNPEKERILTHADMHSAVDYTCYEGMAVKGEIELVMQRGHVIVKENQFLGKKGDGKYLKRHKSVLAE